MLVRDMDIESRAKLLQSLINQLSADTPRSSEELAGEPERVLLGLDNLFELGLITGDLVYGEQGAKNDYATLVSASNLLLTPKGVALQNIPSAT